MSVHFIHFMSVDSPVFNSELVRLINETMNTKEHFFVIAGQETCNRLLQQYDNVIYESYCQLSTICKYDTGVEVLILHSLFLSSSELRHLQRKQIKRMVWCVWGHDLYAKPESTSLSGKYKNWLADRKVAQFRAIVAGFKYDIQEIRHRYGQRVPVYNALYASGYFQEDIDHLVHNHLRTDMRTNIMIGHSGFPFLQHREQLKRLVRYKNENIVITLFLSYGNDEYVNGVIECATTMFGAEKLNIFREFMSWSCYVEKLCDVDIALFDFNHQAAFGNLILLSYLGKKLYLSPAGVMYQALQTEGIEVYGCPEVGEVTFEELKTHSQSGSDISYPKGLLNRENIITQWKQLFQAVR